MKYVVQLRKKTIVLTDPQRRVYDGVPFSSEERWAEWEDFSTWDTEALAENVRRVYAKEPPHGRQYRVVPVNEPKETT